MVFRSVLDMFAEKIAEIENETSQVNKNIDLADQKISDIEAILNSPGPATNATESSNKSGTF
jgi:prefoldin subunit 5